MHRCSTIHGRFHKRLCISVEKRNPTIVRTHCFLHKEVLVAKIAQNELKEVLSEVVELVNFMKTCTVKSRIFELICKDMDSQYVRLLLHTGVRWLSKGKVLSRVHELQNELLTFCGTEGHELFCKYHRNDLWLSRLEYLTEIFAQLNRLKSSMQGRNENILTSTDKLIAFTNKVTLWKSRMKAGSLDMFPLVRKTCMKEMIPVIVEHLTCLGRRVEEYFPQSVLMNLI